MATLNLDFVLEYLVSGQHGQSHMRSRLILRGREVQAVLDFKIHANQPEWWLKPL
jgi:hypothetical protein